MSTFSKIAHAVGHAVWLGAQYENYVSSSVPAKYKPIVAAAFTLVSAVHGYYMGKQVRNG